MSKLHLTAFAVVIGLIAGLAVADRKSPAHELMGQPAPSFSLPALSDGNPVALEDLKGSVVVLDFWATWCGPCVAALPKVQEVARDKASAGVKVFAINLKEDREKVAAFVKEKGLELPVLLDAQGTSARAYKVQAIPQQVVIDRTGKVTAVFIGFDPEHGEEKLVEAIDAASKQQS